MSFENIVTLILVIYLLIINLISIVVTIVDKKKAIKNKWRVQESTLLFLSILGGSLGMYITMFKIRHKTKKLKFLIGIPIIFIFQVALIILIYNLVL